MLEPKALRTVPKEPDFKTVLRLLLRNLGMLSASCLNHDLARYTVGMGEKTKTQARSNGKTPAPAHLDQLRDILYGQESKATSERLESLTKRLDAEVRSLRAALAESRDELEAYIEEEVVALNSRIETDDKKHKQALATEIKALSAKKTRELSRRIGTQAKALDETKKQFSSRMKSQSARLRQLITELQEATDGQISSLTESKMDREALSKSLGELALRFK